MADLRGKNADETVPDIATWGTGNVLETGEGVVKVDLDDKASLSGLQTLTLTNEGSSDMNGEISVQRIGSTVTLQVTSLQITHTDSVSASTTAGFIPEGYRPIEIVRNIYQTSGGRIRRVSIDPDGTVQFNYYDYTGADADSTSATSSGAQASYLTNEAFPS